MDNTHLKIERENKHNNSSGPVNWSQYDATPTDFAVLPPPSEIFKVWNRTVENYKPNRAGISF